MMKQFGGVGGAQTRLAEPVPRQSGGAGVVQ